MTAYLVGLLLGAYILVGIGYGLRFHHNTHATIPAAMAVGAMWLVLTLLVAGAALCDWHGEGR